MASESGIWQLQVLGVAQLSKDGQLYRLKRKKSIALLAYLTISGRQFARETLASLFWPDQDEINARTNLRSVVADINRVLGNDWSIQATESLQLRKDFPLQTDYAQLEQASADTAQQIPAEQLNGWECTLLEGLSLPDCDEFEEWLYIERERSGRLYRSLLAKLMEQSWSEAKLLDCAEFANRLCRADPLAEQAYGMLMRLAHHAGNTEQALKAYQALESKLIEELDISPSQELVTLAASIRRGELPAPPTAALADKAHPLTSDIHYAQNQGVHIAYRQIGEHKPYLVIVWGFASHIDQLLESSSLRGFFNLLSEHFTLILFDKRGMGLSDRVAQPATLSEMASDIICILNDLEIKQAGLFGISEGGPTAIMCAYEYPQRISQLILYGTAAKWVQSEDYPYAISEQNYDKWIGFLEQNWGKANNIEHFAPSRMGEEALVKWWSKTLRMSASPGSVRSVLDQDRHIDVRTCLPHIKQPTLVVQRQEDKMMRVENGRYLSKHIPKARYVELKGKDHWVWVDAGAEFLDAVLDFNKADCVCS